MQPKHILQYLFNEEQQFGVFFKCTYVFVGHIYISVCFIMHFIISKISHTCHQTFFQLSTDPKNQNAAEAFQVVLKQHMVNIVYYLLPTNLNVEPMSLIKSLPLACRVIVHAF